MKTVIEMTTTWADEKDHVGLPSPDRDAVITSTFEIFGDEHIVSARLLEIAAENLVGRGLERDDENWFVITILNDVRARLLQIDDDG